MTLEKLGPYRLEKLLGRGGMGAVYVGVHEETGQRAAVKLLAGHLAAEPTFRERFQREIETLKRLLHPNIVQLYGFGQEGEHLYYVMELVEGRSLQDELNAGRRFTWREAARIGIAVAQALKHAHDRGIIHRDLKPANLLIDAQEHIKLADFGIARLYGDAGVTREGGVIGTVDYMAPEQAAGKPPTSRCDLYALGGVLYTLLTGRPPLGRRSVVELLAALPCEQPVPVRRLAPETPEEFERIIHQLLEKDPQQRIPTALAVANRLRAMEHALSLETRVLEGEEPIPPDQPAVPEEGWPSSARTVPDRPAEQNTSASDAQATQTAASTEDEYRLAPDEATLAASQVGVVSLQRTRPERASADGTALSGSQPPGPGGPGPDRVPGQPGLSNEKQQASRFTSVSLAELRGTSGSEEGSWRSWVLAGGVLVAGGLILGGAIYLATRPPSADQLFARVQAAAEAGTGDALIPVEADLRRFLELYPDDPRAHRVRGHLEELENFRLQRRLLQEARRGKLTRQSPSPVQQALQEALALSGSDPPAALQRLEALLAVFAQPARAGAASSPEDQRCLELARQEIARLRPVASALVSQQRQAIQEQLARLQELAVQDPPAAARLAEGLLVLYGDKPWAEDLLQAAREWQASSVRPPAVSAPASSSRSGPQGAPLTAGEEPARSDDRP